MRVDVLLRVVSGEVLVESGLRECPATVAELNERTDDTLLESEGEDMESCTVECEYETQSECAADPICTWTGGACFSLYSEPCPM